jgi:hypothetical protein
MMERARVQSQLEKIQNSISMIDMHRYTRAFVSREGHVWHTLLLIYIRVLESTNITSTCFQQLFHPNRVFLFSRQKLRAITFSRQY